MDSGSLLSHFMLTVDTGTQTKAGMEVWVQQLSMVKCLTQQQKHLQFT